jgi:UrcA family protein
MTHDTSRHPFTVSRPQITMWMMLGGAVAVGALASGAAGAAAVADDVSRLTLRYSSDSLATDAGARNLYHRIVRAAQEVCPLTPGTHLVAAAVAECRAQSVARAVREINNPRLAALLSGDFRRG